MKKKFLLLTGIIMVPIFIFAQDGIKFDPKIDANFSDQSVKVIQVPKTPIQTQVLFMGDSTEVTVKSGGTVKSKKDNDFIGITPDGDDYWISVNHESRVKNAAIGDGGGMTSFKVVRESSTDSLIVEETTLPDGRKGKFHNVEFVKNVGETWTNCGGIINEKDGRIWTAEEYPSAKLSDIKSYISDTADYIIGYGSVIDTFEFKNTVVPAFKGSVVSAVQNQGWMVEIDPKSGKALRKEYNWGRMSFEGGAMLNDSIVFLTDDMTPGLFTKFVADKKGDFSKGKLFAYNQNGTGANGKWILMNNANLTEMINLPDSAYKRGATMYVRLEWPVEINGKIYIAETGKDDAGKDLSKGLVRGGVLAKHHADKVAAKSIELASYADYYGRVLVYDPATDMVTVYLEGGPDFNNSVSEAVSSYPNIHLSNPDGLGKIKINGKWYMIVQEDLNGHTYNRLPAEGQGSNVCDIYLLDMSISNPALTDLIRIGAGPKGAELTGGNGIDENGKTLLVNIQHPDKANTAPYNNAGTLAMTGFDKIADLKTLHFNPSYTADAIKVMQFSTDPKIKVQTIFSGAVDSVTVVSGGFAKSKGDHDFIGITADKTAKTFTSTSVPSFKGSVISAVENQGWMVEIDPKTGKALRKEYNWGRMSFEGGAFLNDSTIILTDDMTPGLLTKFVADSKNDLTKGKLYAYNQNGTGSKGNWIEMNNSNLTEMIHLPDSAFKRGATMFVRLEWPVEIGGKVYIAETGKDDAGKELSNGSTRGGIIAKHHVDRQTEQAAAIGSYTDFYGRILVYDPILDTVTVYLEGGPKFATLVSDSVSKYPAIHLSNPDGLGKVKINSKWHLVIQEDLNGHTYNRLPAEGQGSNVCDMFLLDMSIANPALSDLIRIGAGPKGAELTGGNGLTENGKTILVNIQHPDKANDKPYNNALTIALHGFDNVADLKDLHFAPSYAAAAIKKFQINEGKGISIQKIFSGVVDSVTVVGGGFASAKGDHDFIGITPNGSDFWISINHESRVKNSKIGDGGGMTSFQVQYSADTLKMLETTLADGRKGIFHNVDFVNTVGETWTNCGGIISPDGRIWTAEEYPSANNSNIESYISDLSPVIIGEGRQGDYYWISVNHESRVKNEKIGDGGGMTSFKIMRDLSTDTLVKVKTTLPDGRKGIFHNIDFANTVGETWTNCGGIISATGRIWTAEEYPSLANTNIGSYISDLTPVVIGHGRLRGAGAAATSGDLFKGELLEKHELQGWMVEIDPMKAEAIRKQFNWGRISFEGGAIADDSIVYLTDDMTPGIFVKFVADKKGNFNKGKLYVYNQNGADASSKWIMMDNTNLKEMINLPTKALEKGATMFVRLEWVIELNGKIYIAETGKDNAGADLAKGLPKGGVIAKHHADRIASKGVALESYVDYYGRILVYDPKTGVVSSYLEGGSEYTTSTSQAIADYPAKHLSNPDGLGKITVNGKSYMIIQEDLNGATFNRLPAESQGSNACEMYLLDMSINNPTVNELTRIFVAPKRAEVTGGNGTPDGKTILVNIQHPDKANTAPYNKAMTIALTGWDKDFIGIKENSDKSNSFNAYPNPATRIVNFNGEFNVALYDIKGNLIITKEKVAQLNIDGLNTGTYFIMNDKKETIKLVIE